MENGFRSYPRQAIALGVLLFMLLMAASLTGTLQAWGDTQTAPLDAASIPMAHSLDSSTAISQNVELVGQLGGFMSSVALQGDYAYVGIGASLVILDVSNSAHPFAVGQTLPFPDLVSNVAVSGTYAYVADSYGGMRVVDVSDPAQPREIGFYRAWDAVAEGVAVLGTHAYVASVKGLHILDISNPASPQHTGFYTTTRIAFNVAIAGNYAYVAVDRIGLRVMDVSDPAHPKEVGSCCSPSVLYAGDVAVAGDYAYVADYNDRVNIVNIADPAHPTRVSTFATPGPVFAVAVASGQAYVVDIGGLSIITVTEPLTPVLSSYITAWGGAKDVAVSDGRAYVAAQASGLQIFNVANPTQPSVAGEYDTPLVSSTDVAEAGTFAYVTDYNYSVNVRGLRIINAADPAHPFKSGELRTLGEAQGVAVSGPYAYIADGSQGLRVVNAANPAHPFEMNPVPMPGGSLGVKVAGDYAYVAAGYMGGLRIVKVSDPASPEEVGAIDTPGGANQVAVAGDFAYVADGYSGLRIVNVADRKHPFEAGAYTATLTSAQDVAVAGSYAYVADGSGTLHIINVADPAHPFEAGHYSTPGCVANVAVMNDLAYVGDCDALRVINVANPTHPTLAGYHELAQAYPVAVTADGLIYVIGERAGLMILRFHLGPPSADFSGSPTSGQRPLTVNFTEAGIGADTWLWSFGDGGISTLPTPTHTYTAAGAYTVSLRVSNAAGSDTLTRTHYITVSGLSAAFSAAPTVGRSPLTVTFANQSTDYTSSRWDFGDGVTSTLDNPTHTYTAVGAYTVTLTVSGPDGNDALSQPGFIAVVEPKVYLPLVMHNYVPKQAYFFATPTVGEAPLTVTFTNASANYTASLWSFGDGTTSTLPNPTHVYMLPGVYTVTLTITGPGGTDTFSRANYVTVSAHLTGVRYVAPGGADGGNDCTHSGAPCATVQYAVDAATPGDEVRIAAGRYTAVSARPRNDIRTDGVVTQVVYISKTVHLRGGYTTVNWSVSDPTAHPTILDAQGRGRVIYITGDISSTVEGLRITGGNGSSDYPVGLGIGGGVYIINAAATLKGCQVYSNTAEWEGGGIYLNRSPSTLIGNIITGNSAQEGGGVYLEFSDATVSGNIIQGNTARRITPVYGNGGGLHVFASAATLSGNTVVSNTAYAGGGMYLSSGAATLGGNIVSGNTASDGGGVFLVSGSATTWSNNTIEGNTASRGGGLYLWAPTGAWLNSNILRSNRADLGGGAYLAQCDATLVNTIIVENQANISGSGVYIEMGTPRFLYTTLARNSGGDGSGIYATNTSWVPSSVALTNTILVSHTVGISVTGSITVAVTVNGVLWFDTPITVSQSATATVTVQNQREGDPAFAGNDYHLRPTSAAVNQGVADDYALDVDGEYRPLAAPPDLGADEVIPSAPVCAARLNGATVYASLQAAIDASTSAGDVIEVAGVCEDAVAWNENLYVAVLTKTLTVRGGYNPGFVWDPTAHPTVLNGHRRGGVLAIGAGASPTVEYLTLLGGQAMEGGGLWSAGGAPVLRHLRLTDNYAGHGGGVYFSGMGGRLEASRVEANRASLGGGLYLKPGGAAIVDGNTLQGNAAIKGGGALLDSTSSATTLSGNTVRDNMSEAFGGGIYLWRGDAALNGNAILNNRTGSFGGGVSLDGTSNATMLSGNTIVSNTATSGGGVHLSGSAAILADNTIQNNATQFAGGGIYLENSPATLRDNTLVSNTTVYRGGGIHLYTSAATLSGNTVLSNTVRSQVDSRGGGIYLESSAATLEDNIIAHNTARQWGGGVHMQLGAATLVSNTLYDNTAHAGGGLYVNAARSATLTGNMVFSNTVSLTGPGGGMLIVGSDVTLTHNIIFSNTASSGGGAYLTDSQGTASGNRIFCNAAQAGGGMYLNRSNVILVNNVIADNQASAGSGVTVEASQPHFLHTTITRNSANGDGEGSGIGVTQSSYGWDASVITLTNTILVSQSVGISMTEGNTLTVNGVLWFGTPITISQAATTTVTVQNQYEGDPVFTADGYHLMPGSAAIDRGMEAGVTTDIDGNARPYGPAPDLGAVEYVPPSGSRQPR